MYLKKGALGLLLLFFESNKDTKLWPEKKVLSAYYFLEIK
jgi:hypothetical protein